SLGFNLIKERGYYPNQGDQTGNIVGNDPLLDPQLRNNGGKTPNHALRVGSLAIDAGNSGTPAVTSDQRGRVRPYDFPSIPNAAGGNGSDIGAFERQGV